jgi:hypothetical protein
MSLIPRSELLAAHEKYLREEATKAANKAAAAPAAPRFKYLPRTLEQWERRMKQHSERPKSRSRIAEEWAARAAQARAVFEPVAAITDESKDESATLKPKISGGSICLCKHRRDGHCLSPRLHSPEGSGVGYYCIYEHCEGQRRVNGVMVACDCPAFRVSEGAAPKQKYPKADDFTPCGNPACAHWRCHHCKARRPSKAKRPKAADWTGFEDERGQPFQCKHTPQDATQNYHCTSTSCAEEGCPCDRYVNPLARPRAKAAKPRTSRKRVEMQMELFLSGEV